MTTSIFIRSWRGDRHWLDYCLKSLSKFAKGFEEIVVVIPNEDRIHFDKFDFCGAKPAYIHELNVPGYLSQQHDKLRADEYVRGEWIMFLDSDCFATNFFHPSDFLHFYDSGDVKAIQLLRHWSTVGNAICWKEPTAKVLGFEPPFEGMAAFPMTFHRDTFPLLRQHIEETLKMPLSSYLLGLASVTFSEFNTASQWALRYQPFKYDWRLANPENDGFCRTIVQRYSHDPITPYVEEYERILAA